MYLINLRKKPQDRPEKCHKLSHSPSTWESFDITPEVSSTFLNHTPVRMVYGIGFHTL